MRRMIVVVVMMVVGCTSAEAALAHKITCDAARVVCALCGATTGGEGMGSETRSE